MRGTALLIHTEIKVKASTQAIYHSGLVCPQAGAVVIAGKLGVITVYW